MKSEKRDEPQKQTGANRNIMFQQRSHIKNDTPIKFNNLKMKQQKKNARERGGREAVGGGGVCAVKPEKHNKKFMSFTRETRAWKKAETKSANNE